jgi:hypothetical protein
MRKSMEKIKITVLCMILVFLGVEFAEAEDCALGNVRCVGSGQEYSNIQAAVNAAVAGDMVLVMEGNYAGFSISRSGTGSNPITIKANGNNAIINSDGPSGHGVFLSDVSNVVIDGFKIQDVNGRCIAARNASATSPMTNVIIQNNACRRSGQEGFYLSQLNSSTIQNNYISATGLNDSAGGLSAHGIYLANAGSKNTTIRNNTITRDPAYPEFSACVHINGDVSIGGDGLITGLLIENNRFTGCYSNGINMDGVQSSTIRNNLVYGVGRHALRDYQIDGAQGPKNLRIYNNIFVVPAGVDGWPIKLTEDLGGHTIFNNILLNEGSGGGSLCVSNKNLVSNNNITVNRMSTDGENTIISLSAWETQTGQDSNSVPSSSAALFINPANADYHLKIGSPAINLGLSSLNSINAPSSDIEGTPRPQGSGYDVGAYEFIEGPPPNPTPPAPPTGLRIQSIRKRLSNPSSPGLVDFDRVEEAGGMAA